MDEEKGGIGRDSDQFMLRMPDGMRGQIKIQAAKNRRSMNAELVLIIERAINDGGKQSATQK